MYGAGRSANTPTRDLLHVLLTQRGNDGTKYSRAGIEPNGSIEWPDDFFDEGVTEAFAILRAGVEKQESDAVE